MTEQAPDLPFEIVDNDDRLLAQLAKVRDRIVGKVDDLSVKLEGQMDPGPALRLEGDDRLKARHLFLSQARKLEAELNKLLTLADNFRVHIY